MSTPLNEKASPLMITHEIGAAGLKASPPVAAAVFTMNEWVAIATVLYILLQGAYLLWKWRGEWLARNPKVAP